MHLLLVLALLPFIWLAAWVLSPILIVLQSIVVLAERLRLYGGLLAEGGYFATLVVLVVLCGKTSRFFWFGVLPVIVASVALTRL